MNKKWIKYAASALIVVCLTVTYTVLANPGSDDDPVISLSYLKEVFKPEVKKELTFEVVSVSVGQTLLCESGTEMILRMGNATIVASAMGGLADVTAGYDLQNGVSMPANHHLIVPKADGRGAKAQSDCLIMVKGGYAIQ